MANQRNGLGSLWYIEVLHIAQRTAPLQPVLACTRVGCMLSDRQEKTVTCSWLESKINQSIKRPNTQLRTMMLDLFCVTEVGAPSIKQRNAVARDMQGFIQVVLKQAIILGTQ